MLKLSVGKKFILKLSADLLYVTINKHENWNIVYKYNNLSIESYPFTTQKQSKEICLLVVC
jgi:hypothetical protein